MQLVPRTASCRTLMSEPTSRGFALRAVLVFTTAREHSRDQARTGPDTMFTPQRIGLLNCSLSQLAIGCNSRSTARGLSMLGRGGDPWRVLSASRGAAWP